MCFIVFLMFLAVQVSTVPVRGSAFGHKVRRNSYNGQTSVVQTKISGTSATVSKDMGNFREQLRDPFVYNHVQLTLPSSTDKNSDETHSNLRTNSPRRIRRSFFPLKAPVVIQEIRNNHLTNCNEWEDRHYCHNDGKCAYIPQLDLKTCRSVTLLVFMPHL
jgi:hypothetical protein